MIESNYSIPLFCFECFEEIVDNIHEVVSLDQPAQNSLGGSSWLLHCINIVYVAIA